MRKVEYFKKLDALRVHYEMCCEQVKQEYRQHNKPKKWASVKVCPECGDRGTKILSLSEGCYICQICEHKYQPPIKS